MKCTCTTTGSCIPCDEQREAKLKRPMHSTTVAIADTLKKSGFDSLSMVANNFANMLQEKDCDFNRIEFMIYLDQ